ncbi:MAG: hypothetical protein V4582_20650 [Pseudomonadota bacterium]
MWTDDEMKRAKEEDRMVQSVLDEANNRPPRPMSTPESITAGNAAIAEGRARAAETMALQIENKELLSAYELQHALGIAQAEIDEAVGAGRLFAMVATDGERYYPAFYAAPAVDRTALEAVALELRDLPPESRYYFFTSRRTNLGSTPLEALQAGRVSEVMQSAAGFAST